MRRIWLPGPGVSTLHSTASDLRNNQYWCWAEPQKAQFVHIASLLHLALGWIRSVAFVQSCHVFLAATFADALYPITQLIIQKPVERTSLFIFIAW